jgi:DnaJ-class molecular chaperone
VDVTGLGTSLVAHESRLAGDVCFIDYLRFCNFSYLVSNKGRRMSRLYEVECYWCEGTGQDPEEEMPWHECEQCGGVGTIMVTREEEE